MIAVNNNRQSNAILEYWIENEPGTKPMLRSKLIRPRLKIEDDQILVRSVPANYQNLTVAGDLIRLYGQFVGRSRGVLAEALRNYEGDSLTNPVIRGLAAVLEQRATFGNEPAINPVELRAALFGRGPLSWHTDIFQPASRSSVVAETAAQFGVPVAAVEAALFADLAEE
jgi:predicted nuclease of restriction endonuclease-like RecB superfamily